MSSAKQSLAKELELLIEKAMKHPGVADVMKAYHEYQYALEVETYSVKAEDSFYVTDSTSH